MPAREYLDFIKRYPGYSSTAEIDRLRISEYPLLAKEKHVYLDYTGAGLYASFQLQAHHKLLSESLFGNPHSWNPTSTHSTELVEQARAYILKFFNASPEEYECVFTSNASGALKLVGEAYPFGAGCRFLLTFDNHNSVNGIREYAYAKGA